MDIRGFLETSFLDWDGKVASVIFLPGCNFRCPFCNNGLLVTEPAGLKKYLIEDIEVFLRERKDFIDGVVLSGGEPTLHPWLKELIVRLKELGLKIKLDTNGSHPEILSELITPNSELINYVAMDLKAPLTGKYDLACGVKVDLAKIRQSINLLLGGKVDYEFRTTVVPTIHDEEDIEEMAKEIKGAKKFVLQQFVPEISLDPAFRQIKAYSREEMLRFLAAAQKYLPTTIVRGI